MVGVVQLVERQVVILNVAGSSPVTHPTAERVSRGVPATTGRSARSALRCLHMRARKTAIAGVAVVLAACRAPSQTAATTTVTSTLQPVVTKTTTVTYTPPPPPGPKTTIDTNGTFAVGTDIVPDTYRTAGGSGCYWARLRTLDTGDVIDNNVSDGPQIVRISPTDAAFITRGCGSWQKSG